MLHNDWVFYVITAASSLIFKFLNLQRHKFTNNITPRSCIRKWKRYKERWWKTSLDNNTFLLNKELFYSFVGPSAN